MGQALVDTAVIAAGALLVNPLPILAVLLMLFSPRATASAPAFAAGWAIGLALSLAAFLAIVAFGEGGAGSGSAGLAPITQLALGVVLLVLALRRWLGRPGPGETKALPGWTENLANASPWRALGLGAAFAGLNPKNVAFAGAAAFAIVEAGLRPVAMLLPLVVYVLIASLGVAGPVAWRIADPKRAAPTLAASRGWLTANYATMMAVVFLLFGIALSVKGIVGLLG